MCCAGPFGLTACLARSCCGAVLHQRGVPRRRPSPVHDCALLPSSACSAAPRRTSPCTAGHASPLEASLCTPARASPPALAHAPRFGSPKQGGRKGAAGGGAKKGRCSLPPRSEARGPTAATPRRGRHWLPRATWELEGRRRHHVRRQGWSDSDAWDRKM